jgi:putative transcriptional regulator
MTTRKKAKTARARDKSEVGASIIRSLKEIRAWQRGQGAMRVSELPEAIPPTRIKAIRKKAARSVRVFSERFGLPAKTVQQWEQGARRPDAASSLLLEVIDSAPDIVAAAAKRRRRAA